MTPVVEGAAINGPPQPAPSIYKKAIFFPSWDQRGRAAYPTSLVSFFASDPSAVAVQSCFCSESFSPALEKNTIVFESGDHAGSASRRSPELSILTKVAGASPETVRT